MRSLVCLVAISLSPAFAFDALLDFFGARIGVANPIAGLVNLLEIYRDRARDFFSSCHQLTFYFHRLRSFDRKLPMPAELQQRVIHGAGFNRADPAASHRSVKHSVAILRRSLVLVI